MHKGEFEATARPARKQRKHDLVFTQNSVPTPKSSNSYRSEFWAIHNDGNIPERIFDFDLRLASPSWTAIFSKKTGSTQFRILNEQAEF